ncbi:alpha/beta fold hydrolase [Methyloceanibacter sp.]|uniref:alpha/beta fold hydrolase n=1 Tax=Methyloceanibacter sp. TaxID=1965321 RepID=UPI003D6D1BE1
MSTALSALLIFIGVGIFVWLLSFVVEALRPVPREPQKLRWAPDLPVEHIEVGGNTLRYIKTGKGPSLVLLHTLRTQLDLFEKVIPELSRHFTVYALDYPGHGYSDIPKARYDAAFFTEAVEGFLDRLDLRDVTLAGVSIGGSIVLTVAARRNPRVLRVIAINPYDYAKGRGMARSSIFGWLVNYTALVPVVGETVMRLRTPFINGAVLRGGVADPNSIPFALAKEIGLVGNRSGHYRAFLSLLRNTESWETATKNYGRIEVPVLLVWGDQDWARPPEREHDRTLIPNAQMTTLARGGHFLALDRPQELIQLIVRFAAETPARVAGR